MVKNCKKYVKSAALSLHCTVYSVHCSTVYSVLCTLHTVQCTPQFPANTFQHTQQGFLRLQFSDKGLKIIPPFIGHASL